MLLLLSLLVLSSAVSFWFAVQHDNKSASIAWFCVCFNAVVDLMMLVK